MRKIYATVVTFNRLPLLKECLEALGRQTAKIDKIIVVNNGSTDGTTEWLAQQEHITIIRQENTGSSGGQYTALKTAYEEGADWIWTMDDDAIPNQDALEQLLREEYLDTYRVVCGTVKTDDDKISLNHRYVYNQPEKFLNFNQNSFVPIEDYKKDMVEIYLFSFVGPMISRKAIEDAGLPNKDFFIHYDDTEYSLRIAQKGKIALFPQSVIIHKEARTQTGSAKRNFFGREVEIFTYDKYKIFYFYMRNSVWTSKKYKKSTANFSFNLVYSYLKKMLVFFLIDRKDVFKKLKVVNKAYRDGLKMDLTCNSISKLLEKLS